MSNSWLEPDLNIQALNGSPIDHFDKDSRVCVILESTLMTEWQQDLYKHINKYELPEPYFERLFEGTQYQNLEHGPVLVDITDYPQLQALWLTRFEEKPLGCIVLMPNNEQASHLAKTLRNRLTVNKTDRPTFLRYYEPRMLLPFIGALSIEERQMFIPQIHTICWHHHQWLQATWPLKDTRQNQLSVWNLTSKHMQKMKDIISTIQYPEVSA